MTRVAPTPNSQSRLYSTTQSLCAEYWHGARRSCQIEGTLPMKRVGIGLHRTASMARNGIRKKNGNGGESASSRFSHDRNQWTLWCIH